MQSESISPGVNLLGTIAFLYIVVSLVGYITLRRGRQIEVIQRDLERLHIGLSDTELQRMTRRVDHTDSAKGLRQ